MALAFSTSAELTLQQEASLSDDSLQCMVTDVWQDFMEIPRCSSWINKNGYKKVALQFPDSYLEKAVAVVQALSKTTEAEIFVLADTSYGSCCIDEVAALHYQADAVIHFGHSCLSRSDRLPVLSIFGKAPVDILDCVEKFTSTVQPGSDKKILVICAAEYSHSLEKMHKELGKHYTSVVVPRIHVDTDNVTTSDESRAKDNSSLAEINNIFKIFGRTYLLTERKDLSNYKVLYVGQETIFLTNLLLTCQETEFYSYDPNSRTCFPCRSKHSSGINKMLMKRFYMVEKVKDAQVVGILVATLSVVKYLEIVKRLKSLLTHAGKKYYVFSVGKINVPKLANFPDVDVFVLVSCPESIILDSSEYYSPIVTPYEVEIACNTEREWTGGLVLDYAELLPEGAAHQEPDWDKAAESTDVSLITGNIRRLGVESQSEERDADSKAVIPRDKMTLTAVSGQLFSSHSWQGLDPKLGQTEVTKAVQGRKGIAIQYEEEPP